MTFIIKIEFQFNIKDSHTNHDKNPFVEWKSFTRYKSFAVTPLIMSLNV